MGEWSRVKKCCYCISLTAGTKVIGTLLFTLTLGEYLSEFTLGMVTKHVYYIQVCSWPTWPRSMMFVTLSWMTCTKSPPVPCLPWTLWWTPPLSTPYWPTSSWWAGNAWIIVRLFLSHLYKMFSLRRWTRWLLLPWLIIYLLDILLLAALTVLLCLYPPPLLSSSHVNYSLLR